MIILFYCGLLLLSPSCKFHYGHSEDSVCENISSYALSLKVFFFVFKNGDCDFMVLDCSMKLCQCTIELLTTNITFYSIYIHLKITIKVFFI